MTDVNNFPVFEILDDLKHRLEHHTHVILQAPPGAGKSTLLPLQLLSCEWLRGRTILMLEPRRLAARSVATRMASLLNEPVGQTVGYRVRFDSKVSEATRILVVTEGILTRMLQQDNALEGIGLVIFDEFHERSLHADLALALCMQVQQVLRDDLRMLVMSATLDGERLSSVLQNAPVITSEGRQHPVSIQYVPIKNEERTDAAVVRIIRKALQEQVGDLLVFLPGVGEIRAVSQALDVVGLPVDIVMLYGDMPFDKQQTALRPSSSGRRKVILATSIAETSLTIEGITTVIDSGYSRVPRFDPRSGLTRLETIRVTRDAADQRAGRAGRLGPGVAYRLWSEATQHQLQPHRQPEILDADLSSLVLELSQWGVQDATSLTWITPPPIGAWSQATSLLEMLGAVKEGKITIEGKQLLGLPTHPRLAYMLIRSKQASERALAIATDLAALLEERDILAREATADIVYRIELLRKWRKGEHVQADKFVLERVERLAASWRRNFSIRQDDTLPSYELPGQILLAAYPERIAQQLETNGLRYKLANGRVATLQQQDDLAREPWLIVANVDSGSKEGKIFLAAPLEKEALIHLTEEQRKVWYDDAAEAIRVSVERRVSSLLLATKPGNTITTDERLNIWIELISERGLALLNFTDKHQALRARVNCLRHWRPEEAWPDMSDQSLVQSLEQWLSPFIINVNKLSELQRIPWNDVLKASLSWEQQQRLDELAPAALEVPSGSLITLYYYDDGRSPELSVRLQEVFGLLQTPHVNEGRVPVRLHLLSPGYKPVQVTQDLPSFWSTTYAIVRKELRMRYPKHAWPEDPWTAKAVRGPVKRK